MARSILCLALAACLLAVASADRSLFAPTPAKDCKSTKVTIGTTAPCVNQFVKSGTTSSLLVPTTITDFIRSADAACALLGRGESDYYKASFGSTQQTCNNGKAATKGVAWTTLYCCAPGTSLATARETRAFLGQSMAQSNMFARQADTRSFLGCSVGQSIFGPCDPTGK